MLILLLILTTCAVKWSYTEKNYYLIEVPSDIEDQILAQIKKPFTVYWNVPTQQCRSKKIPFENLYEKFGITQNTNDSFVGDKIAILYPNSMLFPTVSMDKSGHINSTRNGGIPQMGDLMSHLQEFARTMDQFIPDPNFDGVGVLDFDKWRPIFRQNFQSGALAVYQNMSIDIERETHWWWTNTRIREEARMRFEESARRFMQTTLSLAKKMRPKALWGYYGYPFCFNEITEECASKLVLEENDQISWLWAESTAVYPSVYSYTQLPPSQLAARIRGRVKEGLRVSLKDAPVLPYFTYTYRMNEFFSEEDVNTVLKTLYNSNASGFVIWGASEHVNTVEKCKKLYEYVEQVLGPAVAKYTKHRTVQALDASVIACMKNDKVNALENVTISVSTPKTYCGNDSIIINTNITMNNPFNGGVTNILNINIDSHIDLHAGKINNYLKNSTAKQGLDVGNRKSTDSSTKRDFDVSDAGILDYTTSSDIETSTTEENNYVTDVTCEETLEYTTDLDLKTSTTDENYDFTDVTGAETLDHTHNFDLETSTTEENHDFTDVTGGEILDYTTNFDLETSTTEENHDFTADVTSGETLEYITDFDLGTSISEEYTTSSNDGEYGEYYTANPTEINFEHLENNKIIESEPEFHYLSREDTTRDIAKTKYDIDDPVKVYFYNLVSNVTKGNNNSLHDIVMGTKREKNNLT